MHARRILACGVVGCLSAVPLLSRGGAVNTQGSAWVVFVDDLHLSFRDTCRIRKALRAVVEHLVLPGDRCAIACSGPSCPADAAASTCDTFAFESRRVVGNGLRLDDMRRDRLHPDGTEVRWRAEHALEAAEALVMGADALGGRATLLFVSNGYVSWAGVADRIDRVAAAAAARGTTIVPIDVRRGLDPPHPDLASREQWSAHLADTRRTLRRLAGRPPLLADETFDAALARLREQVP